MFETLNYSTMKTRVLVEENSNKYTDAVCITNLILTLLGIIGNSLSIYVFSQKKMIIRKFNWYLLVMAIFELAFCLLLFIDYLFQRNHPEQIFLHELNTAINMIFEFSIHLIDTYVIQITLILTINRLYAIKHPIEVKNFVTNLHSKCLIVSIFISLIVLKVPIFMLCYSNSHSNFNIVFCTTFSPLVFNIIPTAIILVLNMFLIREIRNYYRRKPEHFFSFASSQHSAQSTEELSYNEVKKQKKLYRTNFVRKLIYKPVSRSQKAHFLVIIAVACWLAATSLPYYSFSTYYLIFRFHTFTNYFDIDTLKIIQMISSNFFNSNHCINFFIYY